MKKIIYTIVLIIAMLIMLFSVKVSAASLSNFEVTTTKTTVNPNENVTVGVSFGQTLGAYTIDVAYDSNLFEYVSSEGGTANDNGTRVRVTYYDTTGGTNPRSNMSVIFKAKSGIITSNPTNFSITATGLSNADASVTYDEITTPIVKNVVVEPKYIDYNINLEYTGDIVKQQEKEMKLSIVSAMGKSYEHVRIIAEVTKPEGSTVKLLAKDSSNVEHDIIQSGWGDAAGYSIGGQNVNQVLTTRGLFSEDGNYSITLKLINRDNSDEVITSKKFDIKVGKAEAVAETKTEEEPKTEEKAKSEELPEELPKTGYNIFKIATILITILGIALIAINRKKNK